MKYKVPELGEIEINTIVLDLNGTLSVNGKIPNGVKERIQQIKSLGIKVILFTGDQRGTASELYKEYRIDLVRTKNGLEKEEAMKNLNSQTTAAIGNARIDIGTFKHAKLSIATLQSEGIHAEILKYVDVVVSSINDALDFFIDKNTFSATMRI